MTHPAPHRRIAAAAKCDGGVFAQPEIVFVDASLQDWGALATSAPSCAEVVALEAGSDALGQIAARLAERAGVGAVHILSHGEAGALAFGSGRVEAASLPGRAAELAAIGAALAPGGEILLYGCETGRGPEGARFVAALSAATGAGVAASSAPVGDAAQGGGWTLDVRTPGAAAASFAAPGYAHLLNGANAAPVISNLDGDRVSVAGLGFSETRLDIGDAAGVADSDSAHFAGGTLTVTVSGAVDAMDIVSFSTSGTGVNWSSPNQGTVTVDGAVIGSWAQNGAGTSGSGSISINLGLGATPARIAKLLNALYAANWNGSTSDGERTITVSLSNGEGGTTSAAIALATSTPRRPSPACRRTSRPQRTRRAPSISPPPPSPTRTAIR